MPNTIKKLIYAAVGLVSMAYYIICIIYAHAGVSWLWIWPLLSVFCAARFIMLAANIHPPKLVRQIYHAALIMGLAIFIAVEGLIISAMSAEPEPGLDYIITLGAAVRNGVPTSPLSLRIDTAAEYLKANPETLVIASGGQGANETESEAETIKAELIKRGIAAERIILEPRSTDTEQNIDYSFELIPVGASVGLVSNSFHLYRAETIARLQGHSVSGVPAPTLLPLGIHYTVREFFAVTELYARTLIAF